jgi:hypothetical protein
VKLTTHVHLVPRSEIVKLYLHSPIYEFMAWYSSIATTLPLFISLRPRETVWQHCVLSFRLYVRHLWIKIRGYLCSPAKYRMFKNVEADVERLVWKQFFRVKSALHVSARRPVMRSGFHQFPYSNARIVGHGRYVPHPYQFMYAHTTLCAHKTEYGSDDRQKQLHLLSAG